MNLRRLEVADRRRPRRHLDPLRRRSARSISERAGVVNLGIEGSMLVRRARRATRSTPRRATRGSASLAGAVGRRRCSRSSTRYFVLSRGSNQLATGLVVLFLALGLTSLFGVAYVAGRSSTVRADLGRPAAVVASRGSATIFFQHDPLDVPVVRRWCRSCWWLLFRSRWGLLLRAAGERTRGARAPTATGARVQYVAVVVGGVLAGIGGAQLSTAYTNAWFENMVQGRGFIAVAVVMFAARNPFKVDGRRLPVRCRARAVARAAGARRTRSTSSRSTRAVRRRRSSSSCCSAAAARPRRPKACKKVFEMAPSLTLTATRPASRPAHTRSTRNAPTSKE